jgi:hypothetical protein
MERCLRKAGFTDIRLEHEPHFLCTAVKKVSDTTSVQSC